MAEILSQSEIDELLSALSSGEIEPNYIEKEEEHKVKVYDFRRPQKFSKDQIRTIELIHDNYSRIISNYLSAQLRANIKVKIVSVQQITYEEFIHSIPNPTVLTIFNMDPLQGSILFEENPEFVYRVMDVLLGGSGDRKFKVREFTDIDKNIINEVNKGLISNLKLAWNDVLKVSEPVITNIETNPALNQTFAPNEPVALITFSVEMFNNSSFLNICIPYLSIEKILDKLVVKYWFKSKNSDLENESRKKVKKQLNEVTIEVIGELGKSNLTVKEFLKLSIGDVITLDQKINQPVKIIVGNNEYAYGNVGTIKKYKGIQITDIIDKDVENYE